MKTLFDVHRIGNLSIKNRVCCPPLVTFFWGDKQGMANERHVLHYENIAKGGQGLIIQEATCVSPTGLLHPQQLGIWRDEQIPGLRAITEAVHRQSCPILLQLHCAGLWGVDAPVMGPVRFGPTRDGKPSFAMTIDEIHTVQQQFTQAAVRAVKAGYDGIELHGCHRYLFCDFLNGEINRRNDQYGRTPTLIVTETLEMIRAAVPPEFIVGIRIGGFEPSLEDAIANARIIERFGVDFLNVSYGFDRNGLYVSIPGGYPFSKPVYAAQEIKKTVGVPVFAVDGIRTPEQAARILEQTDVDMICVGRGLLVDYDWANEARDGRPVGVCLDCNICQWRQPDGYMKCSGRKLHDQKKRSA